MSSAGGRSDEERPPVYPSPRREQEPAPRARSETQRDRDRILYSSAFGRLAGGQARRGARPFEATNL